MPALIGWLVRIILGFFRGSISALLAWLIAHGSGVVKKLLVGLGIGVVTYTGFSTLFSACVGYVQSYYGSIDATVLQFLNYAGVGDAMGIILGGVSARISIISLGHFGRMSS